MPYNRITLLPAVPVVLWCCGAVLVRGAACAARGWVLGANEWLSPKAGPVAKNQDTSVQQLAQLTNYLVHLEGK